MSDLEIKASIKDQKKKKKMGDVTESEIKESEDYLYPFPILCKTNPGFCWHLSDQDLTLRQSFTLSTLPDSCLLDSVFE